MHTKATTMHTTDSPVSAMPRPNQYSDSDRLAIALAFVGMAMTIAAILIALFLDKPWVLRLLVFLFPLSLIYPVLHFCKERSRRILGFIGVTLVTALLGIGVWRLKESVQKYLPPASPGTAVLVQPGGKWSSNCDTVYAPNGTDIENRGEITSKKLSVNAPSSCSEQEVLSLEIASLLEQTKDKNFNEARWTQFLSAIVKDKFNSQVASDFASQPSLEKKKEFLRNLKTSSKP